MTKVKTSPCHAMRVVPHRPWRSFMLRSTWLMATAGAIAGAYWWGQSTVLQQAVSPQAADGLVKRALDAERAAAELAQKLAAAQLASDVDKRASEELRQQLLAQSEAVAEVEREVSLLRLMSSKFSTNAQGVGFGSFSVKPAETANVFQMRLVVHKLAETSDSFKGYLEAVLVGTQAGQSVRLPLHSLVTDDPKALFGTVRIPVEFRYFQVLDASIQLPEGFEPHHLAAKLVSDAKKPLVVEQTLEWLKVATL